MAEDVHEGLSDQAIEARVEKEYPGTLLIPTGGDGVAIFLIPALIIVGRCRDVRRADSCVARGAEGSADKSADEAIVEAAQRERMAEQVNQIATWPAR